MTFYENEMRKFFEKRKFLTEKKFVNKTCLGKLNDNLNVKITLETSGVAGNYTGVLIGIINKNDGLVDRQFIRFIDIWGMQKINNPNFKNGVAPYIWDYENAWYAFRPTQAQYDSFAHSVAAYVEMYK